ncbi:Hypothetical predicted protein [Xyrichtys novacula]|uniref:Uncharacterized protein n=1 Tax=Xyrichtys novacula TaxID=13765 RepID=A0AAV1GQ85_XYRNO|nr:Hypothetical predicted protein [Xyrichtys novacula]
METQGRGFVCESTERSNKERSLPESVRPLRDCARIKDSSEEGRTTGVSIKENQKHRTEDSQGEEQQKALSPGEHPASAPERVAGRWKCMIEDSSEEGRTTGVNMKENQKRRTEDSQGEEQQKALSPGEHPASARLRLSAWRADGNAGSRIRLRINGEEQQIALSRRVSGLCATAPERVVRGWKCRIEDSSEEGRKTGVNMKENQKRRTEDSQGEEQQKVLSPGERPGLRDCA